MKNIFVDYAHNNISISSAFAKRAFIPGTAEYAQLKSVRNDFPNFALVTRKFKTNTAQEHYRGLGYEFMRDYIRSHEADPKPVLEVLDEMIGISKCHSLNKRYPTIKAWFLKRYPDVVTFGMTDEELAKWKEKHKTPEESKQNNTSDDADNVNNLPLEESKQNKASDDADNVIKLPLPDEEKIAS